MVVRTRKIGSSGLRVVDIVWQGRCHGRMATIHGEGSSYPWPQSDRAARADSDLRVGRKIFRSLWLTASMENASGSKLSIQSYMSS